MQSSQNLFNEDPSLIARGVYKNVTVEIYLKSILLLKTQAIANAANKRLEHIGGLAAQIAHEAGDGFTQACKQYKKDVTSDKPFVTEAYNLRSKNFEKIFNVVGPIVENGYDANFHNKKLIECLSNLLKEANKMEMNSIAIPAISCGIFGFPIGPGAFCHLEAFFLFAEDNKKPKASHLKVIKFGLFKDDEAAEFRTHFLKKLSKFDRFDFFDIPKNRSGLFTKYCGGCSSILRLEFFSELSCDCKNYCNFCVSRYNLQYCLSCKLEPIKMDNQKSIWCRECNNKILLTKKMQLRICQNCRNTCFLHYMANKPCSYCGVAYRQTQHSTSHSK